MILGFTAKDFNSKNQALKHKVRYQLRKKLALDLLVYPQTLPTRLPQFVGHLSAPSLHSIVQGRLALLSCDAAAGQPETHHLRVFI